jgi:uncharacterized protein YbjT (DUF2867 family)
MTRSAPTRLLLLGATGAVGSEVLRLALAHPQVHQVVAPTRQPLVQGAGHPKLVNPVTDFSDPAQALAGRAVDAVVCALGTTIRQAGSQAAFAAIDRDLLLSLGREARRLGAFSMALNSSLGASATGNFYLRTKFEAEQALRGLGHASYTVVRPSLIDAQRTQSRPGEQAGLWLARLLGPLVPRRYRPVPATAIAHTLLSAALAAEPGERTVESERITSCQ